MDFLKNYRARSLPDASVFVTKCLALVTERIVARFVTVTTGGARALISRVGCCGFATRNTQPLAAFPQAFTTDAQFAGQFGFGHMLLVLKDEMLEIIFQRQVFDRIVADSDR